MNAEVKRTGSSGGISTVNCSSNGLFKIKTRDTVPPLVCLVEHKVQLSGHLLYRPIHLWKTVTEIVLFDEPVDFRRIKCEC